MVATLKEEIERLSHTQNCPEVRVRSKSRDHWRCSREDQKRTCHQVQFEDPPAPNHSSGQRTESGEEATAAEGSDLEEPPELGPEVASFLRGSPGASEDKGDRTPPEPTVTKLLVVPEIGDHKKLAREVWVSFWLPQQMKELGMKGANLQAPPCLHWQKFMPPAQSIYACRDIRETPQEKAVAYTGALQH